MTTEPTNTAELVARLKAKADYTDRFYENASIGELYREAATALLAAERRAEDAA
jgi:hypothetical protein